MYATIPVVKSIRSDEALQIWQEEGLITADKAKDLQKCLEQKSGGLQTGKGIVIFSTIGAVLIGLGILLFIGSNWDSMSPLIRGAVLLMGYGVICAGAYICQQRSLQRVSESLWFLAVISFGANIFLLAQIFHFSLTFWQGPFLWLIGTLAMGYARKQHVYAWLAVPLGLLALGWFGGGKGWFMDDQLEFLWGDHGLRALIPLIGLSLIALALLARKNKEWSYVTSSWMGWGALFIAVPLVIATGVSEVLEEMFAMTFTVKQVVIMIVCTALVAAAILYGDVRTKQSKGVIVGVAAALLLLLIQRNGEPLLGTMIDRSGFLYALYVIAVFALSLLTVWLGVNTLNKNLVNAGMTSSSIIILIQYFSWSFEMLHSSIAFILGGIVLIGLSIFMEKTRRNLLLRMKAS